MPDIGDWEAIEPRAGRRRDPVVAAVINSDEERTTAPSSHPSNWSPVGRRVARDLSTIFVAGNVMGRGLTLEGLSTTLFLRSADQPAADTQMQMQRWFGYRGSHLELCRVFIPKRQLRLFGPTTSPMKPLLGRADRMADAADRLPSPTVLQGQDFLATGKIADVRNVPLCPGPSPFIAMVNTEAAHDPNLDVVRRCFAERASSQVFAKGRARGRPALDLPMTLSEAEHLDQLRYERYEPPRDGWQVDRWASLEAHIGLEGSDGLSPLAPAAGGDGHAHWRAQRLPLRDGRVPSALGGLFSTGGRRACSRPTIPPRHGRWWTYGGSSISDRSCRSDPGTAPETLSDDRFRWTDVRGADGGARHETRRIAHVDLGESQPWRRARGVRRRPVVRLLRLLRSWPAPPDPSVSWRPAGSPVMVLFHLIERPGLVEPGVAVGVAFPLGGPDQFAAQPGWAAAGVAS